MCRIYESDAQYGLFYRRNASNSTLGADWLPSGVKAGMISLEPGTDANKQYHAAIYGGTETGATAPNVSIIGTRLIYTGDPAVATDFTALGALGYRAPASRSASNWEWAGPAGAWEAGVYGVARNADEDGISIGVFGNARGEDLGTGDMVNYSVYCGSAKNSADNVPALRLPTAAQDPSGGYDQGSLYWRNGVGGIRVLFPSGWRWLASSTVEGGGGINDPFPGEDWENGWGTWAHDEVTGDTTELTSNNAVWGSCARIWNDGSSGLAQVVAVTSPVFALREAKDLRFSYYYNTESGDLNYVQAYYSSAWNTIWGPFDGTGSGFASITLPVSATRLRFVHYDDGDAVASTGFYVDNIEIVTPVASAGVSNLQEAYEGGNTIEATVADGSVDISNSGAEAVTPLVVMSDVAANEAAYFGNSAAGNAIKTGGGANSGNVWMETGNLTVSSGQVNATSEAGATSAIYAVNTASGNAIVTGVEGAPGTSMGHIWMRNGNLQIDEGQISVYANSPIGGGEKTFNVDLSGDVYIRGTIFAEGATDDFFETNLTFIDPTAARTIAFPDASGTVALTSDIVGDDWGTQAAEVTARLTGDGTVGSELDIAQQGASSGQVLKWDGSTWTPADDATGGGGYWQRSNEELTPLNAGDSVKVSIGAAGRTALKGINTAATGASVGVMGSMGSVLYGYLGYYDGSTIGAGVLGKYTGSGSGRYGVYGENASTGTGNVSYGVYGYANPNPGIGTAVTSYGVYGFADNALDDEINYGVYGKVDGDYKVYGVVGDAENSGGSVARIGVVGLSGATSVSIPDVKAGLAGVSNGTDFPIYAYHTSALSDNEVLVVSSATAPAGIKFFVDSDGDVSAMGNYIFNNGGNDGKLESAVLTADRTWTLPDASGTVALTSDITDDQTLQEVYDENDNTVLLTAATGGDVQFFNDDGNEMLFLDESNGRVGIGTITPGELFDIYDNTAAADRVMRIRNATDAASEHGLFVSVARDADDAYIFQASSNAGATSRLYVRADGNVGFGTTTPARTLDVVGTGRISSDFEVGASAGITGMLTTGGFTMADGSESDGYVLTCDGSGIGTWQAAGASTDDQTLQEVYDENGNQVLMTAATGASIRFYNDEVTPDEILFLDEASGYVGIGDATPSYKLHVNGAATTAVRAYYDEGVSAVYGYLGGSTYAVYGYKEAGRYGYLGGTYGAYGAYEDGAYGYLGGASYGAYGRSELGNYGYLGGNQYAVAGYFADDTYAGVCFAAYYQNDNDYDDGAGTQSKYGVRAYSQGENSHKIGLYARASNIGTENTGVWATVLNDATVNVALFACTNNPDHYPSSGNWAAYLDGDVGIYGNLDLDHVNDILDSDGDAPLVAGDVLAFDGTNYNWQAQAGGGGNTLDGAYDQGGAGVGRTITADAGAVDINGSNDGAAGLDVDNTVAATSTIYGVKATVRNTDGGLPIYAGHFEVLGNLDSPSDRYGVYGTANGTLSGTNNYGIYGYAGFGTNNYGIYGEAYNDGFNNYGVYAKVSGNANNYALYAEVTPGSEVDYSGYFVGAPVKIPDFASDLGLSTVEGATFWDNDDNSLWIYNGASWQEIGGGAGSDNDWAYSSGSGLTGNIYHTGYVGVGNNNPAFLMDVRASGATVNVQSTDANRARLYLYTQGDGANDLFLGTDAQADRYSLSARGSGSGYDLILYRNNGAWDDLTTWDWTNGYVGIGTTSPARTLDVNGTGRISNDFEVGASAGITGMLTTGGFTMADGSESDGYVLTCDASGIGTWQAAGASTDDQTLEEVYQSGDNTVQMTAGYGDIQFYNDAGSEMLFLEESSGDVGIGTTTPGHKLDVQDNGATAERVARIWNKTDASGENGLLISTVNIASGSYILNAYSGSSSKLYVRSDGNIGIGTTTPDARLEVNSGTADVSGLQFTQLTSASAAGGAGTKVLSVDASGNVVLVTDATGASNLWTDQTTYIEADNNTSARVYDTGQSYGFAYDGTNQYGVYGRSTHASGVGVYGSGTVDGVYGTGGSYGVLGEGSPIAGVFGNWASSGANCGVGVLARFQWTGGSTPTDTCWALAAPLLSNGVVALSPYSAAVLADAAYVTTGKTFGVWARNVSTSDSAAAVLADNQAASGLTYGLWGRAASATGAGVFGSNTGGGYAGYFNGKLAISNGTNYASFDASALTGNTEYTLPAALPGSDKILQCTSAGVLSWEDDQTGGGAGAQTAVLHPEYPGAVLDDGGAGQKVYITSGYDGVSYHNYYRCQGAQGTTIQSYDVVVMWTAPIGTFTLDSITVYLRTKDNTVGNNKVDLTFTTGATAIKSISDLTSTGEVWYAEQITAFDNPLSAGATLIMKFTLSGKGNPQYSDIGEIRICYH